MYVHYINYIYIHCHFLHDPYSQDCYFYFREVISSHAGTYM